MKKLLPVIAVATAMFLPAGAAWPQEMSPSGLRQPGGIQPASYDYMEAAPEPAAPTPASVAPAGQPPVATDALAPAMVYPGDPPQEKPWTLPQPCLFQQYGIVMGGWIEQGITFNGESGPHFNGPVATNDVNHEYQLNQLWLFFTRAIDTSDGGWDLGGRVDMIYGTDFRYGISHGLDDRINGLEQYYGLVIPQAYAEVGVGDLSVKMGHFAGILSYEQVPSVANFFYSHSYTMGYSEPLLVTGVLGTYKLCDHWSFNAGFHRGWMMFEDFNNHLNFMGGATWTGDEKRTSVTFAVDNGKPDQWFPTATPPDNRFVYSLIVREQLTEKLLYVLQHDLGTEDHGNPRTGGDANWYSLVQYLVYTLNPCWSAGMRFEWFNDADGARVAGVGNLVPGHGWDAAPGFAGDFYELSLGLNWRPNLNVVLRPEVRWDWYNGTTNLQGELPFADGAKDNQFLLGMDLIVTF
jgi:hypothetical protein